MNPDHSTPLRDRVASERILASHPAYDAVELTIASTETGDRTKPAIRHRGAVVIVPPPPPWMARLMTPATVSATDPMDAR